MLRASFACALAAASVSATQPTLNGYAKETGKILFISKEDFAPITGEKLLGTVASNSSYPNALSSPAPPKYFTFDPPFDHQDAPFFPGENEASGLAVGLQASEEAIGDYGGQKLTGNYHNVEYRPQLDQPPAAYTSSRRIDGHSSRIRVAHMLRRNAPPSESSSKEKDTEYVKLTRPQDNDEGQGESANSGKNEARGSELGSTLHAPVRRLTPLLSGWGTARQQIDRRTKKDEETFQAFEKGVAQLKTDTMKELANVLGTRRRPADIPLLENVVAKVGLNGLGGPSPIDLSLKERALMDQARRHRQQVEKIKSKYERDTRYLAEELRDWLQWSNKYRQRISHVVNNGMYTSAAHLSV